MKIYEIIKSKLSKEDIEIILRKLLKKDETSTTSGVQGFEAPIKVNNKKKNTLKIYRIVETYFKQNCS